MVKHNAITWAYVLFVILIKQIRRDYGELSSPKSSVKWFCKSKNGKNRNEIDMEFLI